MFRMPATDTLPVSSRSSLMFSLTIQFQTLKFGVGILLIYIKDGFLSSIWNQKNEFLLYFRIMKLKAIKFSHKADMMICQ